MQIKPGTITSCIRFYKWAATWQNQQSDCAPGEDSDQLGHPPNLIRVIAVRSLGSSGPKLSSCGQRRLIWVFAGCTVTLLVLSCRGSNFVLRSILVEKLLLRMLRILTKGVESSYRLGGTFNAIKRGGYERALSDFNAIGLKNIEQLVS